MGFQLPTLPWAKNELEPFLSEETIECHYDGHHKTYIEKVNAAVEKLGLLDVSLEKLIMNYDGTLYNNAAQAWNHTFYWLGLTPLRQNPDPAGDFRMAVNKQYGNLEGLKKNFNENASALFGSGWTWLVVSDEGHLDVLNTHNGDNPLCYGNCYPLWTCDVWEHAYYVDYRFRRKDYLEGIWKHINWAFVEANFQAKRIPNMSKLMIANLQPGVSTPSFI